MSISYLLLRTSLYAIGDVTGSIQGESALVNCVHWETADGIFFEREEAVT